MIKIKLTKYEQETVINFNAGDKSASIYTADRAVMRRLDTLVNDYPDTYRLVGQTSYAKRYEVLKECVTYRKPRKLTEYQREQARQRMNRINNP